MRTLAPNTHGSHNHKMQTNSIADFQTPSVESGPQLPERNANRHQKKYDQKKNRIWMFQKYVSKDW